MVVIDDLTHFKFILSAAIGASYLACFCDVQKHTWVRRPSRNRCSRAVQRQIFCGDFREVNIRFFHIWHIFTFDLNQRQPMRMFSRFSFYHIKI